MSLKAGRVGVNPADVDPISGHISSEASEGYTKAQADDKFLSKTDASSTYETQSDASTAHGLLQPKTLSVPIDLLMGSQLVEKTTVESIFSAMNGGMGNKDLTDFVTDVDSDDVTNNGLTLRVTRVGKVVVGILGGTATEAVANGETMIEIPAGFECASQYGLNVMWWNNTSAAVKLMLVDGGYVKANSPVASGDKPRATFTYLTN